MAKRNKGPKLILKQPARYPEPYYFIRWYEGGRKRERSAGTSDLGQAETALREFLASRARKPDGPRHPNEIMIADVLSTYCEEHAPTVADPERIAYCTDALLDYWSDCRVSAIKGETCRAYVRHREAQGRAASTAARELRNLRAALKYCKGEGYLTEAPELWYPEAPPPKDEWLTRDEMGALLWAARSEPKARLHLPLFILIGAYTGARSEAILTLQWMANTTGGWVDLEARRIYWQATGRRSTKKRRPRATPIPGRLLRFLKYARQRTGRYVIEIDGEPVKRVKRAFKTACQKAGLGTKLTDADKLKPYSPHILRHSCVTWLLLAGKTPWDVGQYVGMSEEMVTRRYGHHAPDYLEHIAEAFGG